MPFPFCCNTIFTSSTCDSIPWMSVSPVVLNDKRVRLVISPVEPLSKIRHSEELYGYIMLNVTVVNQKGNKVRYLICNSC